MEITTVAKLNEAIVLLKAEKEERKEELMNQFHKTYESLKPANLLKQAYNDIFDGQDIGKKIVDTSIGLGAGVLSKKILVGKPTSFLKKIAGTFIELGVAKIFTQNSDAIKNYSFDLIKKIIK